MAGPRVLVLRAPGTNCDLETAFAFERSGAVPERVHVNQLLANPDQVKQAQILCIPGGFSYGDDVAAGRILANQIQHHLVDVIGTFQEQGKLVLGICNGFQVLIKSGLLLENDATGAPATLTWNDSGRFEDRWVQLECTTSTSVFLEGMEELYLPIAHAEGKFVTRDQGTLSRLEENGQIALKYSNGNGAPVDYPANPNGSWGDVAGVTDESGRIFGLMPHPERFLDPTNHPQWTRKAPLETQLGLRIFQNAVDYFAA